MRLDTIQAGDFLRLSAQRFPDRDCFVFDDGSSRSFAEVNGRVNRLAGALQRRGVRKGDRAAILATDSGEYVEVMLACMKLGVVYVPLNNRLTDAEVLTLLRRAEPKAIFASSRYAARVAALAASLDGVGRGGGVARPAAPGHDRVRVRLHQRVRRRDRGRPADVAVPRRPP